MSGEPGSASWGRKEIGNVVSCKLDAARVERHAATVIASSKANYKGNCDRPERGRTRTTSAKETRKNLPSMQSRRPGFHANECAIP